MTAFYDIPLIAETTGRDWAESRIKEDHGKCDRIAEFYAIGRLGFQKDGEAFYHNACLTVVSPFGNLAKSLGAFESANEGAAADKLMLFNKHFWRGVEEALKAHDALPTQETIGDIWRSRSANAATGTTGGIPKIDREILAASSGDLDYTNAPQGRETIGDIARRTAQQMDDEDDYGR